jgi:hypothetical protein
MVTVGSMAVELAILEPSSIEKAGTAKSAGLMSKIASPPSANPNTFPRYGEPAT